MLPHVPMEAWHGPAGAGPNPCRRLRRVPCDIWSEKRGWLTLDLFLPTGMQLVGGRSWTGMVSGGSMMTPVSWDTVGISSIHTHKPESKHHG